ncbi:TPA: superoxide dismutase [Vibrio vulnificus]|uniref:superoxide dismutase family protein n=1 Tax=Vibrio vulnificus TaxID=672 RepID=UPI0005F2304E|nr:superoxide dismutase family protein [Vibrio vulnificus]EGQ8074373.1 superoxide dismutase family protein [Vibrio vulnificus]EHG1330567.1 superoxide dismutase family protein [Vibrio vulnificus]EHK8976132.1 superoxide dismutase family protein [Vibrio vulnificus]EHK9044857.1 superoxide dismutase family protein [Vibrio vulnificus]EHZ2655947.1 superoxide dismutase family protein [Vibrio vulnificus]
MNKHTLLAAILLYSTSSFAQSLSVEMKDLSSNQTLGTVTITSSDYGTVLTPNLKGLPSGLHGFHLHANGSCESSNKDGKVVLGGAAGGHYDPQNSGKHGYPWTDDNHLGDLPALFVDASGNASQPVLAPRVALKDVQGRALMIHAGADNHSDHPMPLGGGGARIVCGVIN